MEQSNCVNGVDVPVRFKSLQTFKLLLQVFLRNTTHHEPYPLTIPGCNTVCPLDQFITLTDPVVPKDWEQSCKMDDPNYTLPPQAPP
jgi:hypothetical protein